jgi:hypothetical protein
MSSFRSLDSVRSGDFEVERFLVRRVFRRVLVDFDFPRVVRLEERVRLVRREDEEVLFFATNNPSQALSQTSVQNLCHLFTLSTSLRKSHLGFPLGSREDPTIGGAIIA